MYGYLGIDPFVKPTMSLNKIVTSMAPAAAPGKPRCMVS